MLATDLNPLPLALLELAVKANANLLGLDLRGVDDLGANRSAGSLQVAIFDMLSAEIPDALPLSEVGAKRITESAGPPHSLSNGAKPAKKRVEGHGRSRQKLGVRGEVSARASSSGGGGGLGRVMDAAMSDAVVEKAGPPRCGWEVLHDCDLLVAADCLYSATLARAVARCAVAAWGGAPPGVLPVEGNALLRSRKLSFQTFFDPCFPVS